MKKLVKFIEENATYILIVFVIALYFLLLIAIPIGELNKGSGDYEREKGSKCNCCHCKECD